MVKEPSEPVADRKVALAGKALVTVIPEAGLGPLFTSETVYVSGVPTKPGLGAAASVTGLNVQQLLTDRKAGSVKTEAKAVTDAANAANVQGTPTVYVGKLGAKPTLVGSNGTVPTLAQTEAAIKTALAG